MRPINNFLAAKSMTALDLLELTDAEESAFWDQYQAWRQATITDLPEQP